MSAPKRAVMPDGVWSPGGISASMPASAAILANTFGGSANVYANPSVNGHWEITAATRGSRAAVRMTCPPANEVPYTATRRSSRPPERKDTSVLGITRV